MAAQSVALYLRIKTPSGWSFAKAAFTKQNLPRPFYAVVNGTHEHHPEGVYHLRFRKGRKRMWKPIGKDASLAVVQLQNKTTEIQTGEPVSLEPTTQIVDAVTRPLAEPKPEPESGNLTLAAAMTKYLEQARVHKSRKTFLAYRVTLVLYAEYRTAIKLTHKQRSNAEDIKRVISALGNTPVAIAGLMSPPASHAWTIGEPAERELLSTRLCRRVGGTSFVSR